MKRIITSVISVLLILTILSSCSLDSEKTSDIVFSLRNTLFCLSNPYEEFIEEYNRKIKPSEDNQFIKPEKVNFKRLPIEDRLGYNSLKDNEKELYRLIEEAADELDNVIEIKALKIPNNDFERILDCFITDCPDVFYISNIWTYVNYDLDEYADVLIIYFSDGESYDSLNENWELKSEASREKIANQMVSLFNRVSYYEKLIPDGDPYEAVRYIYETIVIDTEYDHDFADIVIKKNEKIEKNKTAKEDEKEEFTEEETAVNFKYQSTAYGAICHRKAICSGYTAAIGLLLNQQGIVNGVSRGKHTSGNYHIWNVVKLNDSFYHLDATNEKPVGGANKNRMIYEYFLCYDEVMKEEHEFLYNIYTPPVCDDDSLYLYDNITHRVNFLYYDGISVYQAMVDFAITNNLHVLTFISDESITKNEINRFYSYVSSLNYRATFSNTYYHSSDYKNVHFFISY